MYIAILSPGTSLHFTSLHFTSLRFTSKQNHFTKITSVLSTSLHFTSLHLVTLNPHLNSLACNCIFNPLSKRVQLTAETTSFRTAAWSLEANSYVLLSQARYWRAIPELILGSLCMTGAALCLLLQETMNKALPRTLQDGETFGEGEGVCDFACCKRRRSIAVSP